MKTIKENDFLGNSIKLSDFKTKKYYYAFLEIPHAHFVI